MNNSARISTVFTMFLIIATVVSPTALAADQSCDEGANIGASASVSVYKGDSTLNLLDYGLIFQDASQEDASQEVKERAWNSAQAALIRKINSTMAVGNQYHSVVKKTV